MLGSASLESGTSLRAQSTRETGSIAYWVLVGALGAFGLAAILTIGWFFLVLAVGLTGFAFARRRVDARMWPTALIGGAAAPLYIAWLNRRGPGEICEFDAGGVECIEQWSPWPFLVVAVLLVSLGVVFVRILAKASPVLRA